MFRLDRFNEARFTISLRIAVLLSMFLLHGRGNAAVWQSDNGDGTFTNPVLYADYPDPDIIRVGEDFYMVSTTFADSPGIVVLKSKDMVNWEIASHAADSVNGGDSFDLVGGDAYRGGYWAASIRHHDGVFYIAVNPTFGNARIYYSADAAGPWAYHQLDRSAYDPGLFIDDDGTGYIVSGHSMLHLMELSGDFSQVVGQTSNFLDAGGEGSHLVKRGEYYYLFNANPTVWPFQLLCARAKSLTGPWETRREVLNATTGGHQGAIVDLPNGGWMGFAHQDSGAVGRMPRIGPVFWENDWPVFGTPSARNQIPDTAIKPVLGGVLKEPASSDGFDSEVLGAQWQWNHNPDNERWSLSERSGHLRLRPLRSDGFWMARNTLTQKGQGPQSHGVVKFDLGDLAPGDVAGFGTLGKVNGHIYVEVDSVGEKSLGMRMDKRGVGSYTGREGVPFLGDTLYLRTDLDFERGLGVCSYSSDGASWTSLGGKFELGFDIEHSTFQGQKYAIFCYSEDTSNSAGYVDVDFFELGAGAEQVVMQRGRPRLNEAGTTFVGDNGQLLRGPFASTEWGPPPPRENLAALKELGLNAVHLYGEVFTPTYPSSGAAPGYSVARIDEMVEMTRELGLYLVLTIGNGAANGSFNRDYALDFWEFYAPRYKNETHVIYEIHNEPVAWSPPYSQAALDMERDAYALIRSHAPDTPVLLFSYAVLGSGVNALTDLGKIGGAIDWSNAAVAFHGYAGHEETAVAVQQILDAGYPCFMTEFTTSEWGYSIDHLDLEMTAALERMEISWLNFLHVPPNFINQAITEPSAFRDIVNNAGLSWVPDYGDWPVARGVYGNAGLPRSTARQWTANFLTGVLRVEAEDFDEGGQNVAYNDRSESNQPGQYRPGEGVDVASASDGGAGYAVTSTEAGEWLEYTLFVNEPGYYKLAIRYATSAGGALRMVCNGVDVTGDMLLPGTGGATNWATAETEVFLEYGQQIARLETKVGGYSFNWFELTPASGGVLADGTYRFVNRQSGMAVQGNLSAGDLTQAPHAGAAQEWRIRHVGAGQYQVTWAQSNRYWSVFYRDNDEPVDLVGWLDINNQSQRYLFVPLGNGFYRLRPAAGGLSVEVADASMEAGAQVQQFEYSGEARQQWAVQTGADVAFPLGLEVRVTAEAYELSWDPVAGASSYSVKRSSHVGGPFAPIATGITSANYSDASVTQGEIWHYVVHAQVGGKESLASAEAVANPPRLHARFGFDEMRGSIAKDGLGSELEGALLGGTSWIDGHEGGAVAFDGVNGYVNFTEGIVSELEEVTLAAWVYLDARPTWSRIFDFGSGTGRYLFLSPNGGGGTVRFAITAGSGEQVINGLGPLDTGRWIHVAVTLKGATGILYVDGAEVGRNSGMTLSPADLGVTTQNYLGRSQWAGDAFLNGAIDDFRIYANALGAEEIAALFEEEPRPPIEDRELLGPRIRVKDAVAYIEYAETVPGRGYQLERKENAGNGPWTPVGPTRFGTGGELSFEVPLDSELGAVLLRVLIRK